MILLLCGCQTTGTQTACPPAVVVYDCSVVSKKTLSDFIIKCAGDPPTFASASPDYNSRVTRCTNTAKELFCQPVSPQTKPAATP